VIAVFAVGWYAYERYQASAVVAADASEAPTASLLKGAPNVAASPFRCDGRIHCSQMTSCAEATYFLQNCPGTKMDGDRDGVPCESQWCR
jgi:hypothetical protein